MKTKEIIKPLIIVLTSALFFVVSVVSAFLLFEKEEDNSVEIGFVRVKAEVYFDGVLFSETTPNELGVVEINISDVSADNYFNNFSVKIVVESNVDTYFRVAVYEQFTLSYDVGDETIVISVTQDEFAPFDYNNAFFDNRIEDDYFYYTNKVKRTSETEALELEFINEYEDTYPLYDSRYSINIGFVVEAVQALGGPLYNWGLENPPWDELSSW
ncbi:MAG TPA: hypothetical protein GX012_04055 [Acholeplasma sp.]|nr:hypothetical protein [Acholeplasma sp.]